VRIPHHVNERSAWSFAAHIGLLSGISSHETIPWQVLQITNCSLICQTKTEILTIFCSRFSLKIFLFCFYKTWFERCFFRFLVVFLPIR
jgi:hypothetical protein